MFIFHDSPATDISFQGLQEPQHPQIVKNFKILREFRKTFNIFNPRNQALNTHDLSIPKKDLGFSKADNFLFAPRTRATPQGG